MQETQKQSLIETYNELVDKFNNFHKQSTTQIENFSKKLNNIYSLSELQTEIYTFRQYLVDNQFFTFEIYNKYNNLYKKEFLEHWNKLTFEADFRYEKDIKEKMIELKNSDLFKIKELLKNELDWIKNTISTIDNLIYGIKYRLQVYEHLNI